MYASGLRNYSWYGAETIFDRPEKMKKNFRQGVVNRNHKQADSSDTNISHAADSISYFMNLHKYLKEFYLPSKKRPKAYCSVMERETPPIQRPKRPWTYHSFFPEG